MDELKPCPFCGEKPLMVHSALNEYHSVAPKIGCSHCRYIIQAPYLAIDMDKSVKENCDFEDSQTISYWNTRPAEDALTAEIERLKKQVAKLELFLFKIQETSTPHIGSLVMYQTEMRAINRCCKIALGTGTDVLTKESEGKDE